MTPAQPHDVASIAALLDELDRYYGAAKTEPLDKRMAQINAALFRENPAAFALLARDGGQTIGLAAYSFLWPALGATESLYLKELYVAQARRFRGIGTLLMQKVCEIAAGNGCSRVEWTADQDNPVAQRFYERLGFETHKGKAFYRLEGDGICVLSSRKPDSRVETR